MDVVLINAARPYQKYYTEHLGLASLSAFLISNNIAVDVLDLAIERLSIAKTISQIMHIRPAMVGISMLDATKKQGLRLVRKLRRSGYTGYLVVGGYFPTFAAKELLHDFPEIDFVVRGEGELTLLELTQQILGRKPVAYETILGLSFRKNGRIIENRPRPLIKELDMLPSPNRKYASHVLQQGMHLRVYASRGCWGNCSFCDIIGFYGMSPGKSWRRRSVKTVVDELESLQKIYNTDHFIFNDDQFLMKSIRGRTYAAEFAAEIKRRNLKITFELMCRPDTISEEVMLCFKDIGLRRVFLGVESFISAQLQRFNKGITVHRNIKAIQILKKLKINMIVSLIMIDADTTIKDLLRQFYFLARLRQKFPEGKLFQVSINFKLELYRGSRFYCEYNNSRLLFNNNYLSSYRYKLKGLNSFPFSLFKMITHDIRKVYISLMPGSVHNKPDFNEQPLI